MTIGLAKNSNGPTSYLPILPWGAWFGISVSIVIFIVVVVLIILYLRGRSKSSKNV
jgi:ribose/xylose/arabinose/galactoside ABC-type transport system permease subunit